MTTAAEKYLGYIQGEVEEALDFASAGGDFENAFNLAVDEKELKKVFEILNDFNARIARNMA